MEDGPSEPTPDDWAPDLRPSGDPWPQTQSRPPHPPPSVPKIENKPLPLDGGVNYGGPEGLKTQV